MVIGSVTGYRRRFALDGAASLLLATQVGGEPLSAGHGFPARLVAPGRRGYHSVNWGDVRGDQRSPAVVAAAPSDAVATRAPRAARAAVDPRARHHRCRSAPAGGPNPGGLPRIGRCAPSLVPTVSWDCFLSAGMSLAAPISDLGAAEPLRPRNGPNLNARTMSHANARCSERSGRGSTRAHDERRAAWHGPAPRGRIARPLDDGVP